MARPRTPIGTFGSISVTAVAGGRHRARTRFRDDDGKVRRVSATDATPGEAERNLKEALAHWASRVSILHQSPLAIGHGRPDRAGAAPQWLRRTAEV